MGIVHPRMCRIKHLFLHHPRSHCASYILEHYQRQACIHGLHHNHGTVMWTRTKVTVRWMAPPALPSYKETLSVIKYHQGCTDSRVILCHALPQNQNISTFSRAPGAFTISHTLQPHKTELLTEHHHEFLEHQLHLALQHGSTVPLTVLQDKESTIVWLPISEYFQYSYCRKHLSTHYVPHIWDLVTSISSQWQRNLFRRSRENISNNE